MKKVIDNKRMEKIIQESGLKTGDVQGAWIIPALFYKSLIWNLARKFSNGECELTHVEYFSKSPDGTRMIDLCLDFPQSNYLLFADFLQNNWRFIPDKLLKKFPLVIGFNYGKKGAMIVHNGCITHIPQHVYESMETEDHITSRIVNIDAYKKVGRIGKIIEAIVNQE